MIYTIQNKQIEKLLAKKQELFKKVNEINKRIVKDDEERKKLVYKAQRIKEKIMPLIDRYYKDGTIKINPPIEIPVRISLVKDVIEIEVSNQVEDYEKMLLNKYEEANKSKKK